MDASTKNVIESTVCTSAEEFLSCLSPQHAFWQPHPPDWIFRGHARADWPLLAKAHRGGLKAYEEWGIKFDGPPGSLEWERLTAAESDLCSRFHLSLDDAGLPIPTEPLNTNPGPDIIHRGEMTRDHLPLLALGQHYGLLTSLLDWTKIGPKAAYFAAADLDESDETGDLCVWCLRQKALGIGVFNDDLIMRVVPVPRASNPNLFAQGGIFTQSRRGPLSVDQHVADRFTSLGETLATTLPPPWMRKVTLPRTRRADVLRLLSFSGISGASMFPGIRGVIQGMREAALWNQSFGR